MDWFCEIRWISPPIDVAPRSTSFSPLPRASRFQLLHRCSLVLSPPRVRHAVLMSIVFPASFLCCASQPSQVAPCARLVSRSCFWPTTFGRLVPVCGDCQQKSFSRHLQMRFSFGVSVWCLCPDSLWLCLSCFTSSLIWEPRLLSKTTTQHALFARTRDSVVQVPRTTDHRSVLLVVAYKAQWRTHFASSTSSPGFSDDFFTSISRRFATLSRLQDHGRFVPFSSNELVAALSMCHESAAGADGLPYSVFKVHFP